MARFRNVTRFYAIRTAYSWITSGKSREVFIYHLAKAGRLLF